MSSDPRETLERVARDSRARLLAYLAARWHDIAAAEDALGDAFHAALATWPRNGVPEKPEAWLLTAARRKLIDGSRHARVETDAAPSLLAMSADADTIANMETQFPDERLKLLFVCAHPAIDRAARTPLMLQTVMGLDAKRIASAFVVKPSAMGQRLTRAKAKIRAARIRFEVPERNELPARLHAVLEAIYAAYGRAPEAVELGRLLVDLLPGEPEPRGLLALMLHSEARAGARRTASGVYVPLLEQDVALWSQPIMEEAEAHLQTASQAGRTGPFQLEAAIQSAHAQRARTGHTDWESIALLYEGLVRLSPTLGALVGRAAAVAEARGSATAWTLLQRIPQEAVQTYQPYWALAAHLLKMLGRAQDAADAYDRAIGLCDDPAMRQFLLERRG